MQLTYGEKVCRSSLIFSSSSSLSLSLSHGDGTTSVTTSQGAGASSLLKFIYPLPLLTNAHHINLFHEKNSHEFLEQLNKSTTSTPTQYDGLFAGVLSTSNPRLFQYLKTFICRPLCSRVAAKSGRALSFLFSLQGLSLFFLCSYRFFRSRPYVF